MILGASMLVVSEAFLLAEKLGLDAQKLFDISSKSSGQCWSMTSYCPAPGLVPTSPANRDYKAGFTAAMMLKDLRLAQDAALARLRSTSNSSKAAAGAWIFPALSGFSAAPEAAAGVRGAVARTLRSAPGGGRPSMVSSP